MLIGGEIYKLYDYGSIISFAGLVLLVAGIVMKRKPTELEQLQIEKLKKELDKK